MPNSRGSQAAISITFMATGVTLMIGGISGNLAPMLSALFMPKILVPRPKGQGSSILPIAPITSPGTPAVNPNTGGAADLPSGTAPELVPNAPALGPGGPPEIGPAPTGPIIELPPIVP